MIVLDGGTLTAIVLGSSVILYALARGCEFAVTELGRQGKARVIWCDPDGGELGIQFHKRNGDEITRGEGESARTYKLVGQGRHSGRYPTWIMHPEYGWAYKAESAAREIDGSRLLGKLVISNPATYHKAITRNKMSDSLNANDTEDKWGWVKPVAIIVCVGMMMVLGMVGFIVFAITKGGGAA